MRVFFLAEGLAGGREQWGRKFGGRVVRTQQGGGEEFTYFAHGGESWPRPSHPLSSLLPFSLSLFLIVFPFLLSVLLSLLIRRLQH